MQFHPDYGEWFVFLLPANKQTIRHNQDEIAFFSFPAVMYFYSFMPVNTFGNIIWLIFGGLIAAFGYFVGGLVLCFTIIGIPFGLQCFKLAGLGLWPIGKNVVRTTFAN